MNGYSNKIIIVIDTQEQSISEHGHFTSSQRGSLLAKASQIWSLPFTFPQRHGSGPQFCKRDFLKKSILTYQWYPLVGLIMGFWIEKNGYFKQITPNGNGINQKRKYKRQNIDMSVWGGQLCDCKPLCEEIFGYYQNKREKINVFV